MYAQGLYNDHRKEESLNSGRLTTGPFVPRFDRGVSIVKLGQCAKPGHNGVVGGMVWLNGTGSIAPLFRDEHLVNPLGYVVSFPGSPVWLWSQTGSCTPLHDA